MPGVRAQIAPCCNLGQSTEVMGPAFRMAGAEVGRLRQVARFVAAPLAALAALAALLEAYLGRRSAARVQAGALRRGTGETIRAIWRIMLTPNGKVSHLRPLLGFLRHTLDLRTPTIGASLSGNSRDWWVAEWPLSRPLHKKADMAAGCITRSRRAITARQSRSGAPSGKLGR